jgi:hypothetical protein
MVRLKRRSLLTSFCVNRLILTTSSEPHPKMSFDHRSGAVVELFDRWDPTVQEGGGDTEANIVVVALCVGLALVAASFVLPRLGTAKSSTPVPAGSPDRPSGTFIRVSVLTPPGRAPTPLRV